MLKLTRLAACTLTLALLLFTGCTDAGQATIDAQEAQANRVDAREDLAEGDYDDAQDNLEDAAEDQAEANANMRDAMTDEADEFGDGEINDEPGEPNAD